MTRSVRALSRPCSCRNLITYVGSEEDEGNNRVSLSDGELEVSSHTGDTSDRDVGSVDEGDSVDCGEDDEQTNVDLTTVIVERVSEVEKRGTTTMTTTRIREGTAAYMVFFENSGVTWRAGSLA